MSRGGFRSWPPPERSGGKTFAAGLPRDLQRFRGSPEGVCVQAHFGKFLGLPWGYPCPGLEEARIRGIGGRVSVGVFVPTFCGDMGNSSYDGFFSFRFGKVPRVKRSNPEHRIGLFEDLAVLIVKSPAFFSMRLSRSDHRVPIQ